MEIETSYRPIRAQDSIESTNEDIDEENNNSNDNERLDAGLANELEAYNDLQLDFESEFADFLSRDVPNNSERVRRTSNPSVSSSVTNQRLEYNADGTVNCCDINYSSLVRFSYNDFLRDVRTFRSNG